MARKRNAIETEPLKVSVTPQIHAYLEQLLPTGLYGKTKTEAAHFLLSRALDDMLAAGRLRPPRAQRRKAQRKT